MVNYLKFGEPSIGCIADDRLIEDFLSDMKNYLKKGSFSANDLIKEFESEFCKEFSEERLILLNNATTALELVLYLINSISNKVNIVSQAVGFFGVHSMIISRGYNLNLSDTEACNFNFDLNELEKNLNNGANVILITHMNGIPANSHQVKYLADKVSKAKGYKIWIIDDLSRSLGAQIEGNNLSHYSDFSIYSFQAKKHITLLGEGGAIVSKDDKYHQLLRTAVGFGNKVSFGFNHKISFSQVLFGLLALKNTISEIDQRILLGKNRDLIINQLPFFSTIYPTGYEYRNTYYLYTIMINEKFQSSSRSDILKRLNSKGIGTCIANIPVYQTSSFINNKLNYPYCVNAEELGKRIFSVSLHPSFTPIEEKFILNELKDISNEYSC